jgi:hypothetical protein
MVFLRAAMDLPESVVTMGKRGRREIRTLESRGRYVICKYLDPETMKAADTKRKLMLFDEHGRIMQYFIVPLKDPKRSLLIQSESNEKERRVWNESLQRAEEIWGH